MPKSPSPIQVMGAFSCDQKCRDYLQRLRWPGGVCCTRCGDLDVLPLPNQQRWHCRGCKYQFSVKSGTIMHDSHLPLRKWFMAIYLMVESRKGISANRLHRVLGVNYRTAWYLCHRIREVMGNDPLVGPALVGVVEVDETYVGGKVKGKGRGYKGDKVIVAGALQRDGKLRVERVPNVKKATLHDFIERNVQDKAEAIYTDELKSYVGIEHDDTRHETVNNSQEVWVVDDMHTNEIENVWSLFKRSLMGAFRKMSEKHMDRYLEELEWRFNNRKNPYIFRDTLKRIVRTGNLTYRELVA